MGTYVPSPKDSTSTNRDGEVQSIPHGALCWRKGCLKAYSAFHTTSASITDCVGEKHPWKSLSPPTPHLAGGGGCLHVRKQRNEGTCPSHSQLESKWPGSPDTWLSLQPIQMNKQENRKQETGGMAPGFAALPENPSSLPTTHLQWLKIAYNSTSRGSNALYCPLLSQTCIAHTHKHIY